MNTLPEARDLPRFRDLLEDTARYPAPHVPIRPILRASGILSGAATKPESPFLQRDVILLRSGRAALATGLKDLGLANDDRVLLPAYHCGSLVEPVLWTGAQVDFYRVGANLRVDLDDIERKCTTRTRCLVAVHYFGFPQPLRELADFCRANSIALVEDCAHAFFGAWNGEWPGARADVSIASVRKFFPVEDGGLLKGRSISGWGEPRSPGMNSEAKALLRGLRLTADFQGIGILSPVFGLAFQGLDLFRKNRGVVQPASQKAGFRWFSEREIGQAGTSVSRWIMLHTNHGRLKARRRTNFRRLHEGLSNLTRGRPLYPELPDGVIPYMFPFLLRDPETDFRALKAARVPMLRWEEVAYSDCPVSAEYVTKLIQIPCHQELRDDQVDWVVGTMQKTLR